MEKTILGIPTAAPRTLQKYNLLEKPPDKIVAITGVFDFSETLARNLKIKPSRAMEKTILGIPTAAPRTLQKYNLC